jgi:neutral amino acid transport system substrate-binding protein
LENVGLLQRMRMTRKQFVGVATTALGAVLISDARAEAQGAQIRVGTLMPLTGAGGPFGGDMQKAVVGAVERINAAGGPLRRRIQLFNEDDQTNADAAVRAAKKLIDVNRVVAVIGTWASSVTLAVAPICQKSNVVEMSTSGSSAITKIQHGGYVYRTEPDDSLWAKAEADFVASKGWKKVALLGAKTGYSVDFADIFTKRLATHGGTVISTIFPPSDQPTFRSEVAKTFQAKPEAIVLTGYEPDSTAILRDVVQGGFKGQAQFVASGFAVTDALIKNVGDGAEGLYMIDDGIDQNSPAYKEFLEALGVSGGSYPYASQAYDMIQLVALAIEASKQATGPAINSKLRAISNPPGETVHNFATGAKLLRQGKKIKYTGASTPIDFNQDGNITVANFAIQQIQNGKRVPVTILKNVTAERWTIDMRA